MYWPTNYPPEIKTLDRWVCCRGKKPHTPPANGGLSKYAKVNDSDTWGSFEDACHGCDTIAAFDLPGFILGDGIVGIDLDHVIVDGALTPEAGGIVNRIDSYTEVSQSGTGLHILCKGKLREGYRSRKKLRKDQQLEVYSDGRMFCMTGNVFEGQRELRERQAALDELCEDYLRIAKLAASSNPGGSNQKEQHRHFNNSKYIRLYNVGDWKELGYASQSEADLALMGYLAQQENGDHDAMIAAFCNSALGKREKARRPDYLERTANRVLTGEHPSSVNDSQVQAARRDMQTPTVERAPFPLKDYPEVIRAACVEVARHTQVDEIVPASFALAVLAAAVRKELVVEEKPGLLHHATQMIVIALGSGERKSQVKKLLCDSVDEYVEEQQVEYKREMREYHAKRTALAEVEKKLKQQAKKADSDSARAKIITELEELQGKLGDPPRRFLCYADDITPERLAQALAEQQGAFSILSAEGGKIIDLVLGLYRPGRETGEDIYLKMYSGDTLTRARVGRDGDEWLFVSHPAGSVGVMIQPDKYRQLLEHRRMHESGLLARMFAVSAQARAGTRIETENEKPIDPAALKAWNELIRTCLSIVRDVPWRLTLSPEAQVGRRKLHNDIETRILTDLKPHAAAASKFTTKVVKIAALFHLCESMHPLSGVGEQIEISTFQRAARVASWLLAESLDLLDRYSEPEVVGDGCVLHQWLEKNRSGKTFTRSDLQRHGPRELRSARRLTRAMDFLAEDGLIQQVQTNGRGSRWQLTT